MILIPSGMAESDGGSEETVVLTDPHGTRHPDRPADRTIWRRLSPLADGRFRRLIDIYERAVLNGCAREVSFDLRFCTVRIARFSSRTP